MGYSVVTMEEIAKKAKVSINTVSRALSNRGEVSIPTRDKILKIAKELNYMPNYFAKGFRTAKTKILGAIIIDNSDPSFAVMLRGIQNMAEGRGYHIILYNSGGEYQKEAQAIKLLLGLRTMGLLINPTQASVDDILEVKERGIPFVLLCRRIENVVTNYVISDNEKGAYIATSYMIKKGYRQIAFLNAFPNCSDAVERLRGYQKALAKNGIKFNSLLLKWGCINSDSGYEKMKDFIRENKKVEALFCFSDYVALGAIRALEEKGFRIPEDIGVVSYDDIEFAMYSRIPLTTISASSQYLGEKAAQILIDIIEEKISEPQQVIIKPELVIRKSC